MNYCPQCGFKILQNTNFCTNCGIELKRISSAINHKIDENKLISSLNENSNNREINSDRILPKYFDCPKCKTNLELEESERIDNKFTCPICKEENIIQGNNFKIEKKRWGWSKLLLVAYGAYTIAIFYFLSAHSPSRQQEKLAGWILLTIIYIVGFLIYYGIKSLKSKINIKKLENTKQINN